MSNLASEPVWQQWPLPLLLLDPWADRVLQANPAAAAALGWSAEQLVSLSASRLFAGQRPALVSFTQAVLAQGQGWTCELDLIRADGSRLAVELSAGPVVWAQGEGIGIQFRPRQEIRLLRERAELLRYHRGGLAYWRRIEQVFREIERENQLILRAAGEGIYGVNAEGVTTFLNPAAERMLGWQADELVGRSIHEVIHHSHADGSHYPGYCCPIYAAFRDGVVHQVSDEHFWRKDGSRFPVEYTSTPIRDNGRLVGAVVVFRDVSERRDTEARLRKALEEVDALKQRLEMENAYLQEEIQAEHNYREIVGRSAAIQQLIRQIELVAPTDAHVLITGESGTGKELIARAIHQASPRHHRPLIRVNCAAIPRELFESEFFGHVKGAFTGALCDRPGRFELADGGTLFLDEVGEIPLEQQGKLLRVLQDQQFERVGGSETRRVDVRVIAATNRELKQAVAERRFREDLYFRLNVFPIESVPLRQRIEDVPLLAAHFLKQAAEKFNRPHLQLRLADIEQLQQYHWSGNIRELRNVIERQVIVAQAGPLQFDLPRSRVPPTSDPSPLARPGGPARLLTEAERRSRDRDNIRAALRQCGGKIFGPGGAAELLGLKPTTLASRIKRWGLDGMSGGSGA